MRLSKREREIINMLIEGYSDKEIAIKLAISIRTIQTYLLRAMLKLGVRNRVSAAAAYVRLMK